MCLMVFAVRPDAPQPFVFASNRDEFHDRPTRSARFWSDHPHVLAGRDEKAGGTWAGCTRSGSFAALSNYRDLDDRRPDAPSRGELVRRFLVEEPDPESYLSEVADRADAYNGFNLLIGRLDGPELHYFSNREGKPRRLESGVYGLSNHLLDTPWHKVRLAKRRFRNLIEEGRVEPGSLFEMLADTRQAAEEELPDTGLDPEMERLVSAPFIVSERYGTRSSTLVLVDADRTVRFLERTYAADGRPEETSRWQLDVSTDGSG